MIPVRGHEGQAIGVLGLGRSGLATATALKAGGATPLLWDDREDAVSAARDAGFDTLDLADAPWPDLAALIVSPGIAHLYPAPHPVVRRAWGEGVPVDNDIGLFFAACPDARVVAVTGTNGKSTTTALIAHGLAEAGRKVQMGGNIGTAVLALDPPREDEIVVLELSSYQIDLARRLAPEIAVFLNLAPDHLDRHGGYGGYFSAKRRLFSVGRPTCSVIGVDEPEGRFLANEMRGGRDPGDSVVAVSATRPLAGRGLSVARRDDRLVAFRDGVETLSVDLADAVSLKGVHNAQNAAAATAVLLRLGLAETEIQTGLNTFPGLAHRMQDIGRIGAVRFVNDSKATNPEAAARSLASYADVYWIAGGQAKEDGLGALADALGTVRHAFLIGEAMDMLADALDSHVPVTRAGTLEAAVTAAAAQAQRDNAASGGGQAVVLLAPACASFDQFRDFEHRGRTFTDHAAGLPGFVPRVAGTDTPSGR